MPIQEETSRAAVVESIGLSSPASVFLLLVSFFFTVSLRPINSDHADQLEDVIHSQIMMSVLMGVAIIIIAVLLCLRGRLATEIHQQHAGHKRDRNAYLHKLALRGTIMFFVVGSVLDFNHFASEIFCFGPWRQCLDTTIRDYHATCLTFHIVRMFFFGLETTLCWVYHDLHFHRNYLVAHGLAVIMAANIVLWFDSLISQSFDSINDINEVANCTNQTFIKVLEQNSTDPPDYQILCWSKNDGEYSWMKMSNKFMYPIAIEFTLLVGEILAGHFFACLLKSSNYPMHGLSNPGSRSEATATDAASDVLQHIDFPEPTEQTQLLGIERSTSNHSWKSSHYCFSKLFLIFAALVNIAFLVNNILVVHVHDSRVPDIVRTMNDAFTYYSTAYMTMLCSCTVAGFICSRSFPRPKVQVSSLEYLMLAAVLGPCFLEFTRFNDLVFDKHSPPATRDVVYPMEELINISQVLLQIIFYFHAKDVSFLVDKDAIASSDNTSNPSSPQTKSDEAASFSRRLAFEDILKVLAVSNFTVWVADSFVLPWQYDKITPSGVSTDHWKTLHNVVEPVTIFYRFNCAMFFWCAFKNVKKSAK